MIKRFSIIRRAYVWLIAGAMLLIGAWILFFMNIRLSEEFTGGVKITIATKVNEEKVKNGLITYLTEKKYQNTAVSVEQAGETTTLSIKTKVENDEKVNELSNQLKSFLIGGKYITSADEIIAQSITGPSVGDYMQKTARNALIV
jgi:preprotein translocase subunit SecF